MDPQSQFCPNEHCTARGLRGQGTIRIHSQKEGRYRCTMLPGHLQLNNRDSVLGAADAGHGGDDGGDTAGTWMPPAGHRGGVRSG